MENREVNIEYKSWMCHFLNMVFAQSLQNDFLASADCFLEESIYQRVRYSVYLQITLVWP